MTTTDARHHIVVLGGGYAGVMAALRTAGRTRNLGGRVTLVNPSDRFVERIRLHQEATGQQLRDLSIRHLLHGTGAELVEGWATAVDSERRQVHVRTANGEATIAYDSLIYALGSATNTNTVPGVAEYAHTLAGPAAAAALQSSVRDAAARDGRLVVCGGGLTGIEAATEFAEAFPALRVSLVTADEFGSHLSRHGQAHVARSFARRGIEIIDQTTVQRVRTANLEVEGQAAIPFDVCLWAGPFAVSPLARMAGLAVNARGQALVDPFLRSSSHPEVLVAGDAAALSVPSGAPIRMSCATAMPMGAQAADTIAASLAGEQPRPFRFAFAGLCLSLGRTEALGQPLHADDRPREMILTGRPAAWLKEAISRYTVFALELERRWPGSYRWPRWRATLAVNGHEQDTRVAAA